MILKKFICGPIDNNTYIIVDEETKKAATIDPSFGSYNKIRDYITENDYILDKILLTHAHWDHIVDVKLLKEEFLSLICIHKLDANELENPEPIPTFSFITIKGLKPDLLLEDNQIIDLGTLKILVLHTPGHTPGCVCFYIKKEKVLFSGDTLFKNSFGRVDFSSSNPQDMIFSLKKLSKLPQEVKVYPGHGNETTISKENWIKDPQKFV